MKSEMQILYFYLVGRVHPIGYIIILTNMSRAVCLLGLFKKTTKLVNNESNKVTQKELIYIMETSELETECWYLLSTEVETLLAKMLPAAIYWG